jgi:hypothetical protein
VEEILGRVDQCDRVWITRLVKESAEASLDSELAIARDRHHDHLNAKLAFRATLRLDARGCGLYLLAPHARRPRRR